MNLSNLITALIIVESSGNDMAIGDNGRAIGPLQIHRGVVLDVNRIAGTRYRWVEMTNRTEAMTVCKLYLRIWGGRIGRTPTDRDLAMIWHHGPNGWKRPAGEYWRKVRARMGASLAGGTDPRQ